MSKQNFITQDLLNEIENELKKEKIRPEKEKKTANNDFINLSNQSINNMLSFSVDAAKNNLKERTETKLNLISPADDQFSFFNTISKAIEESVTPLVHQRLYQEALAGDRGETILDYHIRQCIENEVHKWCDKNINAFVNIHVGGYLKEKLDRLLKNSQFNNL